MSMQAERGRPEPADPGAGEPDPQPGAEEPDPQPDAVRPDPGRVAVISVHTSPRDQPGTGDSGGMNVYVLEVADRLAEQGVAVDIFTRGPGRRGAGAASGPEVEELAPRSRLIHVPAGPSAPVAKE